MTYEAIRRQWSLLRAVPRHPRRTSVAGLRAALAQDGFAVTKRTVERDLVALSAWFPLERDERSVPHGWCWAAGAPRMSVPGMSNDEALTFALVEQQLKLALPAATLRHLAPYFREARHHLDSLPTARKARGWLDKVRTIPPTQPLLPPTVDARVQETVYQALLDSRALSLRYGKRGGEAAVRYAEVHPLALVQRGPVVYLHCLVADRPDRPLRTFALHRISAATALDVAVSPPPGYSIDAEIGKGTWGFGDGSVIDLVAVFSAERGEHLFETPLAKDQKLERLRDKRIRLEARVADTPQLLWWLRGFGNAVVVLMPADLRRRLARTGENASRIHRTAKSVHK